MLKKRSICENCKTGRDAYELDSSLPMCPYIINWENNKCSFYEPIEELENGLLEKISNYFKSKK